MNDSLPPDEGAPRALEPTTADEARAGQDAEAAGGAPSLRRPKFRDRDTAQPAARRVVTSMAGSPSQQRGLLAALLAIALVVIVLAQMLRGGSSTPAALPTAVPVVAPAGALAAQSGAPLQAVAVVPAGGAGHLSEPHEAVVGPGGAIYVADPAAHAVVVYSAQGAYLRSLVKGGEALKSPYALAVGGGALYVLDSDMGHILVYSGAANSYTRAIGTSGQLGLGRGIARGAAGALYVANPARNSIVVYDAGGKLLNERSLPLGAALGQYNQPAHVAVGPDGSVLVLDNVNQRVEKFDKAWTPLGQWPAPASDTLHSVRLLVLDATHFVATDPDGGLLFYDTTTNPATITRHGLSGASAVLPLGVTRADKGHLLVTDSRGRAVWRVALP